METASCDRLAPPVRTDTYGLVFNSAYEVVLEKDLSLKQQKLDVVIIEKTAGQSPAVLPDGLENLVAHNLMTYKSHQESLDGWAIEELCGHYVNYRKQISPSFDTLLPADDFRLYAVSTRYPEKLASQVELVAGAPGIYDIQWGIQKIRMIVLSRITKSEKNAPWLIFSAESDKVTYGAASYRWNSPVSSIINKLFEQYQKEGVVMAYTLEDFQKEVKEEVLKSLTKEDIEHFLKELAPEERLKGLKPEDRLKGLRPEELMRVLKPEDRLKGLKPEDRLKGLKPEEIEEYLKKIKR